MRKQEISKQVSKKPPEVINLKDVDVSKADKTVYFVEVGTMPAQSYAAMLQQVSDHWNANKENGECIVIPVRNGCLKGDIIFNNEILNFVRSICKVEGDEIVLKENFSDLKVVRTMVQ